MPTSTEPLRTPSPQLLATSKTALSDMVEEVTGISSAVRDLAELVDESRSGRPPFTPPTFEDIGRLTVWVHDALSYLDEARECVEGVQRRAISHLDELRMIAAREAESGAEEA